MRWLDHHRLSGQEFEQSLGDGGGQGACIAVVYGVSKVAGLVAEQKQAATIWTGVSSMARWGLLYASETGY